MITVTSGVVAGHSDHQDIGQRMTVPYLRIICRGVVVQNQRAGRGDRDAMRRSEERQSDQRRSAIRGYTNRGEKRQTGEAGS
ncbi:MAG TPA: hypothetical protein VLF14_10615 [Candidatus Binatia bacterium]|nr:hypothetical protein [Candidatus Binatia bacterium]